MAGEQTQLDWGKEAGLGGRIAPRGALRNMAQERHSFGDTRQMDFSQPFFTEQLITYIGNKRRLLPFINDGVEKVKQELGRDKLTCLDGFAGSGAVSRLLKYHADFLCSNDLESYAYIVNKCYLTNQRDIDVFRLQKTIDWLNSTARAKLTAGFIYENYAPKDDGDIQNGERVFYTGYNAKMLDTLKGLIYSAIRAEERHLYLAPLIVAASVNANTSGVFKGFHKKDGRGHFGGRGEHALSRIKKPIDLKTPIFGDAECGIRVSQKDINDLVMEDFEYDLAYYDPPYNQHPYGSNYFMLNILATRRPEVPIQDGVSGIVREWNRSAYNKRAPAIRAMNDLMKNTRAKYILISYNNEGIIPFDTFREILSNYGRVSLMEQDYNTYRGCRNLSGRNMKVKELLWLVRKGGKNV